MSKRLIYEEDAIEAICKACSMEGDYHKCDGYPETSTWCDELVALRALPSAQPELIETTAYIRGFEQGRTQGRIDAERTKVKWIKKMKVTETDAYTSYDPEWYCPKCGTKYDPFFAQRVKFCCMCGVGIMEEQDSDAVSRRQIK